MKKLVVLALFLALGFPSLAPAQTFSVEQENQIKAVIQQITDLQIQILLARIEELKVQIAILLAQQSVVEQKVDTIITNTMPAPKVTPPTNKIEKVVTPVSISLGTLYCNPNDANKETVYVPIVISGSDWRYGSAVAKPKALPPNWNSFIEGSAKFIDSTPSEERRVSVGNNWGETTITVELGKERKFPNDLIPVPEYTFTDTIVVGDVCNL